MAVLGSRRLRAGLFALSLAGCRPTGEPPTLPLTPETEVERQLSPGEKHGYLLALEPGDFIDLTVEQQGVDVVVRLFDPRGERLLEMDLPIADLGPEPLLAVAEKQGGYRLEIEAWDGETSGGSYRAALRSKRPANDTDRLRAEAMRIFSAAEGLSWNNDSVHALERYAEALTRWQRAGDAFWQAVTLFRMGSAHLQQGHGRQAVAVRQQAADLFRSLGETRFEAIVQNGLGAAWFELDELEQASRHHLRALELRRRIADKRGVALALQSLADIYKIQGETQKALDRFSQSLQIFDQPKDRYYRAFVLHNLGTLFHLAGNREVAMDHLREAEQIFAGLGETRQRASALSRRGQLAFELGNAEQALAILGRALELHRQVQDLGGQAVDLSRIGSIERELGETEKARDHYLEALELLRGVETPRIRASVLTSLGALYAELGRIEEALACHREALVLFQDAGDLAGQAGSFLGVAGAERRRGGLVAALRASEKALTIAENLRVKPLSENLRFSFFSTAQRFFELHIELLMELHQLHPAAGHAAAAFQMSERSRARSLLDLLGEATAEIRGDAAPELLAEELALQKRLNATVEPMATEASAEGAREAEASAERVREILGRLDTVRAEIRRRSPRYAALTQPRTSSLAGIQEQVLDPETLLLEYKLGAERSFLWLVGRETFASFELPPRAEIERSVRRVYELMRKGSHRESEVLTRELLCDLSDKLLRPLAERRGRQRLAIVAEGALQFLPFAALPDPDSHGQCSEALPLVASHEIVYLPSASTLAVLRREGEGHRVPAGLVAVLADPVFGPDDERIQAASRRAPSQAAEGRDPTAAARGPDGIADPRRFRRLHHSRQEAESILRLVPPDLAYQALDFDASKETVLSGRLAGYRIVHFGTHGVLHPQQPELSGIVLSLVDRGGQPVDGFLRAHEIYNLKLSAELVVLGACETALGKDVAGEGLVGLARGFMYAGASRIVVSLWQVSDRGTSELMTAFYQALFEQGLAPAAALRQAQLSVREENPHPYHWAGFVLQGEWQGADGINKGPAKGS